MNRCKKNRLDNVSEKSNHHTQRGRFAKCNFVTEYIFKRNTTDVDNWGFLRKTAKSWRNNIKIQGVYRPVTAVAAVHCRLQKSMGSHHHKGVCWRTVNAARASRDCMRISGHAVYRRPSNKRCVTHERWGPRQDCNNKRAMIKKITKAIQTVKMIVSIRST